MNGALTALTIFAVMALISLALCGSGNKLVFAGLIGLLISIPGCAISLLIIVIVAIRNSGKE